jgi:Tol biopolymer transport system component
MEATADETTAANTEHGVILGTAGYMSPEQARGVVDKRCDVWAFGCVLFEMLAGKPVFREATWIETLTAIGTRDPDYSLLPADVSPPIQQLIARCLEKDPRLRLRDIGEARIALGSIISGDAPKSGPRTAPQLPPQPPRVSPAIRWTAIGAAFIVVAAVGIALWKWPRSAPGGERMEFTVSPPDGVTWGELPEDPWPRLSPNGEHILYSGRSANGTYGLWVRDIASVKERLLPDTQDAPRAKFGFWSPDSQTVGYCRNDQIKLVDLGDRPPRIIDAANCFEDATWNQSGEILYSASTGLFRVMADGTGTVQVTTSAPGTGHWYPRWLPDGRRFIYTVRARSGPGGEFLASIDNPGAPKQILADATMVEYAAAGDRAYLAFVRGGTLLVWQVDPSTLAGIGDPVPIAKRIALSLGHAGPFSAGGSALAYRSGSSFPDAALVWMDRSGNRVGRSYAENTPVETFSVSHDEKTIAFARYNREAISIEMWTADVARGTEQLVFSGPAYVSDPVFSADDRTIAVANQLHIATIQLGGSAAPVNIPTNPSSVASIVPTTWSADGKTILASSSGSNIVRLDLSQTPAKVTTLHAGLHPSLSPDGRWLAYDSSETGTPQIEVEKYPEGTPKVRVSRNGGFQAKWRSTGAELFFLTSANDVMAARIHTTAGSEHIEADEPTRLFRADFHPDGANFVRADYAVTRDGQRFLVRLSNGWKPLTIVRNWFQAPK